jgi:hypothetical protein
MSDGKKLFWVTCYSIAMGFLESAVVIYLRKLYYPNGFSFPLAPMHNDITIVEIWREAATIIMLLAIGILAGRNRAEKFAWFIFSFAVWDIFYYLFLWVFIGWPQSLFTWDILFLIPVPWVGPVITPVIIAVTMILFAVTVVYFSGKQIPVALKTKETMLLIAGSLVVIFSFTKDYMRQNGDILYHNIRQGGALFTDLVNYVPHHFDWLIFSAGELLLLAAWALYVVRIRPSRPNSYQQTILRHQ